MTLQEVLGRLQRVKGPGAGGEYMARCPCHDDSTQSLSVGARVGADGHTRILFCCHAGCRNEDIFAALGIKAKDLIVDPDPEYGRKTNNGARRTAAGGKNRTEDATLDGMTVHTVSRTEHGGGDDSRTEPAGRQDGLPDPPEPAGRQDGQKERPKINVSRPDVIYSYQGADGKEAFQVCRYYWTDPETGRRGKDFRQRRYLPQDPKAGRDGFVYSVPAELRDTTLYRLPEVLAAVREGRTVYVVEGEKDVETLRKWGYAATCNPGGAGKWREGYTARLEGADVVILPDNDPRNDQGQYAGQDHAYAVALALNGRARRVRLVNLKEACPELPSKGDVSDMVQLMGDTAAMDALARQVAATRDFTPEDVPFWLTPLEQCGRLYHQVPGGYDAENGCIVQHVGDNVKPLTDFVVIPRAELIRDDGVEKNMFFVLDGYAGGSGRRLDRVTVSGSELENMNWVAQKWGFSANILPGSTTKGKVAWAIKKVGQLTAKRVTEYSHTGWRRIDGKWAFLYQGGAVGAEGVTVSLADKLATYRLDGGGSPEFRAMDLREAIRKSLALPKVMHERVGLPILATMYLAPLREWMSQTDVAPAFALFLYGETGTHKSTAAALGMAHWGNFHAKNPPASFRDTSNATRRKAFYLKDVPILVDDYYPTTSQQEKRTMATVAQNLSRAFGDGADRGRLQSDGQLQTDRPPRAVAMMTGEVLPDIGASGLARFFIVNIDRGDIPITKELTEMQEDARKGWLQKAMRGYITWLARQADGMPERCHDLFLRFRDMVRGMSQGSHDRAPEAVACLLLGYNMLLNYARDQGVITDAEAREMLGHGLRELCAISDRQTDVMAEEKPTKIFIDIISESLASGRAWLRDIQDPNSKAPGPNIPNIGWKDQEYYYLLPQMAYSLAVQMSRAGGTEFPLNKTALWKQLAADGMIDARGRGESWTKQKWLDGKNQRVIWLRRGALGDVGNGDGQQLDMSGMVRVDAEVPEEWKGVKT